MSKLAEMSGAFSAPEKAIASAFRTITVVVVLLALRASGASQVAPPLFSPEPGRMFSDRLSVVVTNATEGADIRYTLDGSEPTRMSLRFETSLVLTASAIVKAKAFRDGLDDSVTVAAGYWRQRGMICPGRVVAWGDNRCGQCNVPVGLSNAVQVAAGYYHTVALRADGTVLAWGNNDHGQCGVPDGLSNVVAVAAGQYHTVALRADGTVLAWGENGAGQCQVPSGLKDVIAVSSRSDTTVALKADGSVAAWGNNEYGQCNVPVGASNVVAVASGAHFSVAVRADGALLTWGSPYSGIQFIPSGTVVSDFAELAVGETHTVVLQKDGNVKVWGSNDAKIGTVPAGVSGVRQIAAGGAHTLLLLDDGSVLGWGYNWQGQCDVPVSAFPVTAMAGGENHSVAVVPADVAGRLSVSPESGTAIPRDGFLNVVLDCDDREAEIHYTTDGSDPTMASPRYNSALRLSQTTTVKARAFKQGLFMSPILWSRYVRLPAGVASGRVVAWGDDYNGQCEVPTNLVNVLSVAAGRSHSVALGVDGRVHAWGANDRHQCDVPGGLSDVVQIAAGSYYTVALKSNGTAVAWGIDNNLSQIPSGLSNVVAVAAGYSHTAALKSDGTVVAWNDSGLCSVPVGLSNVVALGASRGSTVALKRDGTVSLWGGINAVPVGLSNVVSVAVGDENAIALKKDGTVVAWGSDGVPQYPAGLDGVMRVFAGGGQLLALKNDGTVLAWGYNGSGQCNVPVGLTDVLTVSSGGGHVLALVRDDLEPSLLHVLPDERQVSAEDGEVFFDVTNAMDSVGWMASVVSGGWARVTSGATGTNVGTVAVAYEANADGSSERQAIVRVRLFGSTAGVNVRITQAGSAARPLSEYVANHPGVPFKVSAGAWYQSDAEGADTIRSAVPSRGEIESISAQLRGPGWLTFDWCLRGAISTNGSTLAAYWGTKAVQTYKASGGFEHVALALPSGAQSVTWSVKRGSNTEEVYGNIRNAAWCPLQSVSEDSADPRNGCTIRGNRIVNLAWRRVSLPADGLSSGYRLYAGVSRTALIYVCETNACCVSKERVKTFLSQASTRPMYWRVDTFVRDPDGREAVARGSLWSVTALPDDALQFVDSGSGGEPAEWQPVDAFPAATVYAGVTCSLGPFAWQPSSATRVTVKATSLPAGFSVKSAMGIGVTVAGVPSAAAAGSTGLTYRTVVQLAGVQDGKSRTGATVEMPITVLPLGRVAGSYTGFVDDGQRRRGLASMNIQPSGAISGKVRIGAADYVFGANAFDGITNGHFFVSLTAVAARAVVPNAYSLGLEVSRDGKVACVFDGSSNLLVLVRNNWGDADRSVMLRERFEGYYTVALPQSTEPDNDARPAGIGYLTMTLASDGSAKLAGMLADGVPVSGSTTLLYSGSDQAVYVPIYLMPSSYPTAGSGLFGLAVVSNETATVADTVGKKLNVLSGVGEWVNRNPLSAYGYSGRAGSNELGFAEEVLFAGGYYDKTKNLQDDYTGQPLQFGCGPSFKEPLDFGGVDGSTGYTLDQLPHAVGVTVSQFGSGSSRFVLPSPKIIYLPGTRRINWEGSENPWGVGLALTKSTGVVEGSFKLYYSSASKLDQKSRAVTLRGVLIPRCGPTWPSDALAVGFYLVPDQGTYSDSQGAHTYKFNWSKDFYVAP